MSSALAIAAVTQTLRSLLARGAMDVTTRPPDQAERDQGQRLNLFLYQTTLNAAWRNREMPGQVKAGEQGHPPLALNLHYLITAHGNDDQRLLGRAMGILHDHPVLGADEIRDATGELPQNGLDKQVERVRITPEALSLDEMSKLWTTFQAPYRISAVYQASVVLIESSRPTRAPLPVLKRGSTDNGVQTAVGAGPILDRVEYRDTDSEGYALPAAEIGSTITFFGSNLRKGELVFRDPKHPPTVNEPDRDLVARLDADPITPERIKVMLPLRPDDRNWVAGVLTAALRFRTDTEHWHSTNILPIAVAPRLKTGEEGKLLFTILTEEQRKKLEVGCLPPLDKDRAVFLLLDLLDKTGGRGDSRQIPRDIERDDFSSSRAVFDVHEVPPGEYRVRLRADGVDSLLLAPGDNGQFKPEFDERWILKLP